MSSYLSFYAVPKRKTKDEPKQYILLTSYSRNNDIYQYFDENLHIAYAGNEEKYTSLTSSDIDIVYANLNKDIKSAKDRLELYEKYASTNVDYIQEIIDLREYVDDLKYTKEKLSFLKDVVDDIDLYDTVGLEEVCCNID